MTYIRFFSIPVLFFSIFSFSVLSDKEEVSNPHRTRSTFDAKHIGDGKHDVEFDHRAVLGSEKQANEFDDLPPEESKKRLRILALKMDVDKDGFIINEELNQWVHNSLTSVDMDEIEERFDEIDAGKILNQNFDFNT
jgi:hypothetical protein